MQLTAPSPAVAPAPIATAGHSVAERPTADRRASERSAAAHTAADHAAAEVPALGAGLLAAALALPLAGTAQAQAPERTTVSVKVLDYEESQPGAKRIRVRAPALGLAMPLAAGDWSLAASTVADTISGASPAYHTSALTRVDDVRYAAEGTLTRHFSDGASLGAGAAYSSENDYVSRAFSLHGALASDDRNTTWNAGAAATSDRIDPVNRAVRGERKRTAEVLAGVTQVLSAQDIVQATLRHARGRGYFSDPYKVFDSRPRTRDVHSLLVRWNHHFGALDATSRASWRIYRDSWGVRAHTLALEWVQELPGGLTLTPLVRLHTQTAARFYQDAVPGSSIFAPNPPAGAEHYSQDQRLSNFGARTLGVKLAAQLGRDWVVDVKFERYSQRASWSLLGRGSPHLAPFDARSVQLGAAYSF